MMPKLPAHAKVPSRHGVELSMRIRWKIVLPVVGLLLFTGQSYESLRMNREAQKTPSRYFWWSAVRLDSDPLNRHPHPQVVTPCKNPEGEDCVSWDPVTIWVNPGWLDKTLMISAFPAFVVGVFFVHVLGRYGISEVSSFMVSMPILIFAWYYAVGWLLDRWSKRSRRSSPA
jgi:hypothetical protein